MIPLYVVVGTFSVLLYIGWMTLQFRRDYLTTWQGHRIQIVHRAFNMDVIVNEQLVLSQVKKKSHTVPVQFGAEGQCRLLISPHVDSNGTIDTIQVAVDDEILPVLKAPTNFWGNTIDPTKNVPLLLTEQADSIEILDERYPAAKRLYERIRQQNHHDPEFVPALDTIFQTLLSRFRRLEEIEASLKDYQQLGTDTAPVEVLQQQQEIDINTMLQGLQELHVHIVQIQDASDTEQTEKLKHIVYRLEAELELT